jgi:hypothetical protein
MPSRLSPAAASRVASISPLSTFFNRVCDVAAQPHDLEVRPQTKKLGGAARRGGADHRALRQRLDRFGADQPVARVARSSIAAM